MSSNFKMIFLCKDYDGSFFNFTVEGTDTIISASELYERLKNYVETSDTDGFFDVLAGLGYIQYADILARDLKDQGGLAAKEIIWVNYEISDAAMGERSKYTINLKGADPGSIISPSKSVEELILYNPKDDLSEDSSEENSLFDASELKPIEGFLDIKYENECIRRLLAAFNYSSGSIKKFNNFTIYEDVGEYYGVQSLEEFTKTLIAVLVNNGEASEGFTDEMLKALDEIEASFTCIKGVAEEECVERDYFDDDSFEDDDDYDESDMVSHVCYFNLTDKRYTAEYQWCSGEW